MSSKTFLLQLVIQNIKSIFCVIALARLKTTAEPLPTASRFNDMILSILATPAPILQSLKK